MRGFRAHYEKFEALNTEIIEISCDPTPVQRAWVASLDEDEGAGEVQFHVASDFWPHGEVTKAFDVFNEDHGNEQKVIRRNFAPESIFSPTDCCYFKKVCPTSGGEKIVQRLVMNRILSPRELAD